MANENIAQRDMSRVAVIDIKTSGPVYDANEILQVSVKDGNGNDLLNTYVMPNKIQSWPSVIEKTHIMPQMVSNAPEFEQIHDKLQAILDNADMIVSYDGTLGTKFLEANHIDMGKAKPHIDMMRAFAPVYGEKKDTRLGIRHTTDGYKWKPLDIACEHYGMIINKYDAAECTKGVLSMAKTMYGNQLERLSEEDLRLYAINGNPKDRVLAATESEVAPTEREDYTANDNTASASAPHDMSKVVVLDAETTGLVPGVDELLQITAKDGNGKVLMDEYVKPQYTKSWPYAMAVNHITPDQVANAPAFDTLREKLQGILDNADTFITYNGEFDMDFFIANGVNVDKTKPHLDVMKAYAPIHGDKGKGGLSTDGFGWKKLTDACEHYHIDAKDAHNSSKDVDATLAVAKAMYGENLERLSDEAIWHYAVTYDRTKIQDRETYYAQKAQKKREGSEEEAANNKNDQKTLVNDRILGAYIYKAHPEIVASVIHDDPNGVVATNIRERINDQSIRNTSLIIAKLGQQFHNDKALNAESALYSTYKRCGENDAKYVQAKKHFASVYPNTDMDKLQKTFDKVANTNRHELERENFKVYKSAIDGADISHDETSSPTRDATKPRYDGEEVHPFSRQTAFFRGTVVPDFGSYNPDTKKLELLHGFRFETAQSIALNLDGSEAKDKDGKPIYGVPRDNDPNKMIMLSKMDDDGKRVERQIPEHQYRHMIDTQMSFEAERENTAEHTWEWTAMHDDYVREMEIDLDKPRLNTWENFVHNFQLRCKLYANNPNDAMRQAKFLVDDMTPQQRKRFNERLRMHGELEFNKVLVQKYKDIKDEEKVDKFYFTTEGQGAQNEALALVAKEDREQKPSTAIADTHFKVGDIIPMSFRTKGFNVDNAIESPISDYQIAKVSKGFRPERAILYSKEARSMYCVPLTDLVMYLQKYEQQRKSKRELTKQDYTFITEQERVQEKKSMLKKTQNVAKNIVRAVKDKYYAKHYEGR